MRPCRTIGRSLAERLSFSEEVLLRKKQKEFRKSKRIRMEIIRRIDLERRITTCSYTPRSVERSLTN